MNASITSQNKTEKLQKVLADAGLGSRRKMEAMVVAGRVRVDGKLAKLGDRVGRKAVIYVDDQLVNRNEISRAKVSSKILIYHKPVGEICTRSDKEGRPTVFDQLPRLKEGRWIAIGRLDLNTSGLLLFTNDGALANRWMHPSSQTEREYAVRILGKVEDAMLTHLQQGVQLEDGMAKFDSIIHAGGEGMNQWYHVTLREGRHREVRRLWETQGVKVSRLIRIRFGDITLPRDLKPGEYRYQSSLKK